MLQFIGRGLVVAGACVLAASFAGGIHGLGDSLAVFRPVILLGCVLVSLFVWRWRGAQALAIAAVALGLGHVGLGAMVRAPQVVNFTHYQKNLLYRRGDRAAFVADVLASNADVVTLQELSEANLSVLVALQVPYPHRVVCDARHTSVAILSRTPLTQTHCSARSGFARAVTQVNGRDVQVYSLHLNWPYPYSQQAQAADILQEMADLAGGFTVVSGDFNMVPSGRSIAWIEQATGTARVGPDVTTYELYGYPLAIDHILATGGTGTLTQRGRLGSDHYGLLAQIELP